MKALPIDYYNWKSSWMRLDIFKKWFFDIFVPGVKKKNLPQKAILLLDNAGVHPDENLESTDGNIKSSFRQPNATSLMQPMNQSAMESMKRRHRKAFIQMLLFSNNESNVIYFWNSYSIKDAIWNLIDAWNDLSEQTLQRS